MVGNALTGLSATAGVDGALLLLVLKATLILVATIGVTALMRRGTAQARHGIWLVALASLPLLPALATWGPLELPVLPAGDRAAVASPTAPATDAELQAMPADPGAVVAAGAAGAHVAPVGSTDASDSTPRWLTGVSIAIAIWAAVALALVLALIRAAFVVRRIVRNATPLTQPQWLDPLYEVSDRLGLDDAPRLVKSDDVKMPFACGLLHPTIVLPADCDRWPVDRRHAVLLHELAHVQRRDLAGHTLGRVACALYWFHPLVWSAARRLRAESERACDDIAIACGARAADYAEHLLDIVSSVKGDRTPAMALAMAQRKEFEGRMLAILDPDIPRVQRGRFASVGLTGGVAALALLVGAAAPGPRTALRADEAPSVSVPGAVAFARIGEAAPTSAPGTHVDDVRGRAAAASQGHVVADVVRPVLEHALGTAVPSAIEQALMGMINGRGTARDDERPTLLVRALASDTSARVRRVAAWGLAEYPNAPGVGDALVTALRRDVDANVREMAAWALAEARRTAGIASALVTALGSDADVRVRRTAAWALGEVGDDASIASLMSAARSNDAALRVRAIWAIGEIEPQRAPDGLVNLLKSADGETRYVTAWALYNIADRATARALLDALRAESDPKLQVAYVRAIVALDEASVDVIRELLDSRDERVREIAIGALAGQDVSGPWPWPWPDPRPFP